MTKKQTIDAINQELTRLREERSKAPWKSLLRAQLQGEIGRLLIERDRVHDLARPKAR